MSGNIKLWVYLFAGLLAMFFVLRIVQFVLGILGWIVPVLAVVGIAALVFTVVNRKSLGSGRRRILP